MRIKTMQESEFLGTVYNDGDVILEEGASSREMYIVQSGKVEIVKRVGDKEAVLATLDEGGIFGAISMVDAKPRTATVTAVGETRVLAVDQLEFLRLSKADPALTQRILISMGHRIREQNDKLCMVLDRLETIMKELAELEAYFHLH